MDKEKKAKLEKAGWKVGDAEGFLSTVDVEAMAREVATSEIFYADELVDIEKAAYRAALEMARRLMGGCDAS